MPHHAPKDLIAQLRENRLLDHRSIFISEAVSSETAERVISSLLILDASSHESIDIYINSPGGEVNSGLAIHDTIRYLHSPVRIINSGLCASIATIINISVDRKNRFSLPHSKFLIHQPLISGYVQGPTSDIEITANEVMKTRATLNRLLAEACGKPFEKLELDTQRDYWMSAKEAVEYGLIGKVINHKKDL